MLREKIVEKGFLVIALIRSFTYSLWYNTEYIQIYQTMYPVCSSLQGGDNSVVENYDAIVMRTQFEVI